MLSAIAFLIGVIWVVFGLFVLIASNISYPKNIKQYIFQSLIVGPFGVLFMICYTITNHNILELLWISLLKSLYKINKRLE